MLRVLALIFAISSPAPALGCVVSPSALILHDPIVAMRNADAVFSATVKSWTKLSEQTAMAELDVHEVWKGNADPTLINYLSLDCSVWLEPGATYVIYAYRRVDGQLEVSGSAVLASRAEVAVATLRRHAE